MSVKLTNANEPAYPVGALRVWWIPQIPMNPFYVDVNTVEEAVLMLNTLARYDAFQFDNRIKPDYCNIGGLEIYEADDGDGVPGWSGWCDEETGEDDPAEYVLAKLSEPSHD